MASLMPPPMTSNLRLDTVLAEVRMKIFVHLFSALTVQSDRAEDIEGHSAYTRVRLTCSLFCAEVERVFYQSAAFCFKTNREMYDIAENAGRMRRYLRHAVFEEAGFMGSGSYSGLDRIQLRATFPGLATLTAKLDCMELKETDPIEETLSSIESVDLRGQYSSSKSPDSVYTTDSFFGIYDVWVLSLATSVAKKDRPLAIVCKVDII